MMIIKKTLNEVLNSMEKSQGLSEISKKSRFVLIYTTDIDVCVKTTLKRTPVFTLTSCWTGGSFIILFSLDAYHVLKRKINV